MTAGHLWHTFIQIFKVTILEILSRSSLRSADIVEENMVHVSCDRMLPIHTCDREFLLCSHRRLGKLTTCVEECTKAEGKNVKVSCLQEQYNLLQDAY